jgi:hypothetical protein
MIKHIKTFLSFFILLSFSGCVFDSGSDTVVDGYEVTWIDLVEKRSINKGEELVPAYVFAVGHDSKYIFAKQYPLLPNSPDKIDKRVINYFVIEITKEQFQDKSKYGPLTKQGFDGLCLRIGIQNPKFDMNYPINL